MLDQSLGTLFGPERRPDDREPLLVVSLTYADPETGLANPVGKGRPRSRIAKGRGGLQFVHVFTDARTRGYEAALRAAAIDAMKGRPIIDEPVEVLIFAYFKIPESWPRRKVEAALLGEVRPTIKPDWENIAKTTDAFNPYRRALKQLVPIVWRDDAIVVDGRVVKLYAQKTPGIIVEVRRAGPPPIPWARRSA